MKGNIRMYWVYNKYISKFHSVCLRKWILTSEIFGENARKIIGLMPFPLFFYLMGILAFSSQIFSVFRISSVTVSRLFV